MAATAEQDSLDIIALDAPFGAEIAGIDLGAVPDASQCAAIRRAFLDNQILVFRGQCMRR
ncbi:MAG: hypothetical protein O3B08_19860 [Proteobacteria bacterium]|nr:hypothetical protein [Pseudomonadota bacterium]